MKNLFTIILLLFTIGLVYSCKDDDRRIAYSNVNAKEANAIVLYNNALLELTDEQTDYLSRVDVALIEIRKYLGKSPVTTSSLMIMPVFSTPNFSRSQVDPEIPPLALTRTDRVFFKTNVKYIKTNFATIKAVYNSLNDYLQTGNYKHDNGRKGNRLIDSLYKLGDTYYTSHDILISRLIIVGDGAERILLKKNPLRDYIFAMKNDQKAVVEFYELLNSAPYSKIATKAKTKYDALVLLQKEHSQMDLEKMKKEQSEYSAYAIFYQKFNELLVLGKKLIKNGDEKGVVTDIELEMLLIHENNLRNAYNDFVD